jgi:tetratricopeptide (TPR) repeat protein
VNPARTELDPAAARAIDGQASWLMKRGLPLLAGSRPADIAAAVAYFERALDLRRQLPLDAVPLFRYGLSACWVNRGDALMALADPAQIPEALRSYDEALVLLRSLQIDEDSRFRRRLAITLQNRGLALRQQGDSGIASSVAAFSEAIAVLEHEHAALVIDGRLLLAVIWMNLANALIAEDSAESSRRAQDAAQRAIDLSADLEATDADAADVALKARHVLCQSLAARLSSLSSTSGSEAQRWALVHEATDAADEGVDLARRWARRGMTRFGDVADDLYRFGALVYAQHQPHLLDEFVRDNHVGVAQRQFAQKTSVS